VKVSPSGENVSPMSSSSHIGDHFASWLKEHLTLPEAFCLFCRSEKTGDWRHVREQDIFHLMLAALSLQELLARNRLTFNSTTSRFDFNTRLENPIEMPFYLEQDLKLALEVFQNEPEDFSVENWLELPHSKDEKRLENVVIALAKKEIVEPKRGVSSQIHYAASVISTVEQRQLIDESKKAVLACTRTKPPVKLSLLLTLTNMISKEKGSTKRVVTRILKDETHQVYRSRLSKDYEMFIKYSAMADDPLYPSSLKICEFFDSLSKKEP